MTITSYSPPPSALTVLQIIQQACKRIGILPPNTALSSTDNQILQLVGMCEEECQEQADYPWQSLQVEAIFTTVATLTQGTLYSIAPGCNYIVNDTIWNRTLRRPVYGPKSESAWQQSVALQINGPFNAYRIQGENLNFYPVPVAGQTCAFEFITNNWASLYAGGAGQFFANDADTTFLNDQLTIMGTIWRFKQAKGLDYAEDFAKYQRRLEDAKARDASKPILSLQGQAQYEIQPVIAVPTGSFGQ